MARWGFADRWWYCNLDLAMNGGNNAIVDPLSGLPFAGTKRIADGGFKPEAKPDVPNPDRLPRQPATQVKCDRCGGGHKAKTCRVQQGGSRGSCDPVNKGRGNQSQNPAPAAEPLQPPEAERKRGKAGRKRSGKAH